MGISRRQFLNLALGGAAVVSAGCQSAAAAKSRRQIMTVLGPIPPEAMGITLPHEHVLVDFVGAENVSRDRYSASEVFELALPYLARAKDLGCDTLVECTPAYLGRDPRLLKRLATASRLHLLTNTGYYGAGKDKFLPKHAFAESADQLAARWARESHNGIEDTGVRPGFIKIGVDAGKLSEMHRKLVRAAARAHLRTGLTIAAHTGNGAAALDELSVLSEEGVAPGAFIWVHAQNEKESDLHVRAAQAGAWVEFDGVSPKSVTQHAALVLAMKQRGLLRRVLLSHDAGWYHVGEPRGGNFRAYDTLFVQLVPALKQHGLNDEEVEELLVENPREAFTVQVRTN